MKPNPFGLSLGLLGLLASPLLAGSETSANNGSFLTEPSPGEPWYRATLTVGYESLHVYRGVDSSAGNPIAWQSLDIDLFDRFRFNLYNGNSFNGEYGELTPSAYIYHKFGPYTASAGMIWYHFPGEDGIDSEEYFLSLSRELGAGFAASIWASYNARAEGWYHEAKLTHGLALTDSVKLVTYAALGFSQDQRTGGNGLDNLTLGAGLPIQLGHGLALSPVAGYAFALDALDTGNEGWVGLNFSYSF